MTLFRDGRAFTAQVREKGNLRHTLAAMLGGREEKRSFGFILWLVALVTLTPIVGQPAALLAFVLLYLMVWGGYRIHWAALYTLAGAAALYFLYDQLLHVPWVPPIFFD